MSLDVTRLAARMRAQPQPAAAGFDPNEDPVIIGARADAPAGPGAIAIGADSFTNGSDGVALGEGADAEESGAVAVGWDAVAGVDGTAVGRWAKARLGMTGACAYGSQASANAAHATAVGDHALVGLGGDSSTAVGDHATTGTYANATALGAGATATADHQMMFGTDAEIAQFPGQVQIAAATVWLNENVGALTQAANPLTYVGESTTVVIPCIGRPGSLADVDLTVNYDGALTISGQMYLEAADGSTARVVYGPTAVSGVGVNITLTIASITITGSGFDDSSGICKTTGVQLIVGSGSLFITRTA